MSPDFEKFCLAHCCAVRCKDRMDYCPIADLVRNQYGKIDGTKCEKVYMNTRQVRREMSEKVFDCVYNLWTGFVGKATCEAGYLKCDGLSCPMYTQKKDPKPVTNYDLLISMPPEKLAMWMLLRGCPTEEINETCMNSKTKEKSCTRCWLDWLKSPVEVDE